MVSVCVCKALIKILSCGSLNFVGSGCPKIKPKTASTDGVAIIGTVSEDPKLG